MAKNNNRGPAPSHKTVSILIARAGGRCQFENCNKNVFLDEVTLDDTNDSNVAHIIASSPDGPRGSKTQSFEMSDKIENLMLMCLDHHHLIDEKGQEHIYTVERLRAMKASQEERVQKLILEDRVGFLCSANYSKNSELDITVRKIIDKMVIADELAREHDIQYNEALEQKEGNK